MNLNLLNNDNFQPVNATIADGLAVGTINDNDGPSISVADNISGDPPFRELGLGQTTKVRFTLLLSAPSPQEVKVTASTSAAPDGNQATASIDYTALPATVVTFPANTTSKTVDITVKGDWAVEEGNERFALNLTNPVDATIADGQAIGTIVDDDCAGSDDLTYTDLGTESGDDGTGTTPLRATGTILCNNGVKWYRFWLTEDQGGISAENLTTRVTLDVGSPPQGGGDLDLYIYKQLSTSGGAVGYSNGAGTNNQESVELTRTDTVGADDDVYVYIRIVNFGNGNNTFVLNVYGDVTVTNPGSLDP